MSDVETRVLEAIRERTKENPLTRSELRIITQKPDNASRDVIKSLKLQGYRIGSSAGSKGYWWMSDEQDVKAVCKEIRRKAITMLMTAKAMEAYTEGQESINGI